MTANNNTTVLAGIIWGFAGFALIISNGDESLLSASIRTVSVFFGSLLLLTQLTLKFERKYSPGLCAFLLYVILFLASNLANEISHSHILREVFLLYIVVVLYVLLSNERMVSSFVRGLYFCLVGLVFYAVLLIDFSLILAPVYRLQTEIGANGIGAMAVAAFTLAYGNFSENPKSKSSLIHVLVMLLSVMVVIATRSRTSIIMLGFAVVLLSWLFEHKKFLIVVVVCFVGILAFNFSLVDTVLRVGLFESATGDRDIYNLTGRTDVWFHGVSVILNNLILGVGPASASIEIDDHEGTYHNAFIQLMVTVGFFGAFPIIIILVLGMRNALCSKTNKVFRVIFLTGLLGAFAESRLLNYGSPANLLLLLSVLYFSSVGKNAQ